MTRECSGAGRVMRLGNCESGRDPLTKGVGEVQGQERKGRAHSG